MAASCPCIYFPSLPNLSTTFSFCAFPSLPISTHFHFPQPLHPPLPKHAHCTAPFSSDIRCFKHISHHLICIRSDPFHFLNFLQSTTLASVEFVLSKTPVALVCLPCLESSSCSASLKHNSTHNIVSDLGHLS